MGMLGYFSMQEMLWCISGFVVMCGLKDVETHFSDFPKSHDTDF
jgi:hypothetical protein